MSYIFYPQPPLWNNTVNKQSLRAINYQQKLMLTSFNNNGITQLYILKIHEMTILNGYELPSQPQ